MIVPLNLRSLSPIWRRNPGWRFEDSLIDALDHPRLFHVAADRCWDSGITHARQRSRVSAFDDLRRRRANRHGRCAPGSPRCRDARVIRATAIANYMTPITPDDEVLAEMGEIAGLARSWGGRVLFYVTPIDYDTGIESLGERLRDRVGDNIGAIRAALARRGEQILDLSASVPASKFGWRQRGEGVNEHMSRNGRHLLSRRAGGLRRRRPGVPRRTPTSRSACGRRNMSDAGELCHDRGDHPSAGLSTRVEQLDEREGDAQWGSMTALRRPALTVALFATATILLAIFTARRCPRSAEARARRQIFRDAGLERDAGPRSTIDAGPSAYSLFLAWRGPAAAGHQRDVDRLDLRTGRRHLYVCHILRTPLVAGDRGTAGRRQHPRGQSGGPATGRIRLSRGVYRLFVTYVQAAGAPDLEVDWARDAAPLEPLPAWALVPEARRRLRDSRSAC